MSAQAEESRVIGVSDVGFVEQLRRVRISIALGDCGRDYDRQERQKESHALLLHAIARCNCYHIFRS